MKGQLGQQRGDDRYYFFSAAALKLCAKTPCYWKHQVLLTLCNIPQTSQRQCCPSLNSSCIMLMEA